jgi:putative peptidoglycan lipid II flippase
VRAAASLLGSGNIATFNYAQKLVELPIGVLITTIGTVSLSRLSGYFAAGNHDLARLSLFTDLRLALALGLLVVAFGIGLAEPLVSLIFFRGAVSADQVEDIVTLTRIALLGVPFIAVSSLATSTLNAQLRAKEVMRSAFLSIIALLVLIAPGLVLVSETLLMSSVVGSQAVLAWLLARRADICLWGSAGVINHQFLRAATLALLLSAASIMIILSYNQSGIFLLLGLSIIGFTISVVAFLLTARN